MKQLPEQIIDFHVHLFPDKLSAAIWHFFSTQYRVEVIHKLYYRECVEYLRQKGVSPIVYSNYAHKAGVAQSLNEWNFGVLEEFPDLYCFAPYHPDDDNALALAERVLDHPRVIGFKLQLLVQRFYPHDERLFPLYEMVMDKKKRILFHVGTGPKKTEFLGLKHFKKVLERYPDIPATIAHMGAREYEGFLNLLDDHPGIYLDTAFAFIKGLPGIFDLDPAYLEWYKDRILYGSDFPNLIRHRESEIACLLDYDLSQEFYDRVFYENAIDLLRESSGVSDL